jgi:2-polyprenyl-3-methyl-5-hydroxy-6-metoxy-1,4-benzoquinol methylase
MSNYWKNFFDSVTKQFDGSLLKQVGKTLNGQEISEHQVSLIVEAIVTNLQLDEKDSVVDLCCGNGLVTRRLAPLVKEIIAVDFSDELIAVAVKHNNFHNIKYISSDVLNLDSNFFLGSRKVLMNEALQHLSEPQFGVLLDNLKNLEPGSLVFFGGIADKEKLKVYYDTEEKFAFYMQREREGKPHMGKWWLMKEIERLASTRGFKTTFLSQLPTMFTAYYRFDALLEKF